MSTLSLPQIHIAAPCPMAWDDLRGDGPVRHCDRCDQQVYNLAELGPEATARLLESRGRQRVCAMIYRRPDGTIMMRDCPVGLAAARRRAGTAIRWIAVAAGTLLATTGALLFAGTRPRGELAPPLAALVPTPPPTPTCIMGEIAIVPPAQENAP